MCGFRDHATNGRIGEYSPKRARRATTALQERAVYKYVSPMVWCKLYTFISRYIAN